MFIFCLLQGLVPIYDASGFKFSGAELDKIKELPLYRNGNMEVRQFAVACVGWSGGTYTMGAGAAEGLPTLSAKILFVLVLGFVDGLED